MVAAYRAEPSRGGERRPSSADPGRFESGFTRRADPTTLAVSSFAARPSGGARPTSVNDEAVGYLGDRLAGLGVEDELFKAGAQARAARVTIGDMTFDRGAADPGRWATRPAAAPTSAGTTSRRPPSAREPAGRESGARSDACGANQRAGAGA